MYFVCPLGRGGRGFSSRHREKIEGCGGNKTFFFGGGVRKEGAPPPSTVDICIYSDLENNGELHFFSSSLSVRPQLSHHPSCVRTKNTSLTRTHKDNAFKMPHIPVEKTRRGRQGSLRSGGFSSIFFLTYLLALLLLPVFVEVRRNINLPQCTHKLSS